MVENEILDLRKCAIGTGPAPAAPDLLKRWLLGTRVADSQAAARPWLYALRRYRHEWLRLAEIHRDGAVPWAKLLLPPDFESERYAPGF